MIINKELMDSLTEQAKVNPRLRQAYDLRTTPNDSSQRILNACEPGTVLPIHRHRGSTETITCLRGKCVQYLYQEVESYEGAEEGFEKSMESSEVKKKTTLQLVDAIYMAPYGAVSEGSNEFQWVPAMSVEVGQWHRLESLESGTVILECKDGKYEPLSEGDIQQ